MEKNKKELLKEEEIKDESVAQLIEETEEVDGEGGQNGLGCISICGLSAHQN